MANIAVDCDLSKIIILALYFTNIELCSLSRGPIGGATTLFFRCNRSYENFFKGLEDHLESFPLKYEPFFFRPLNLSSCEWGGAGYSPTSLGGIIAICQQFTQFIPSKIKMLETK